MRSLLTLIVSALIASCAILRYKPISGIEEKPRQVIKEEPKIDLEAIKRVIEISCDETCTEQEKLDLVILTQEANRVFFSQCFKDFFINAEKLDFTNSATGEAVIKKLWQNDTKTTLSYFFKRRNFITGALVVGYEKGDGKVYANRLAWKYLSTKEKVSNLLHEITHIKGFVHNGNNVSGNEYSVPYQANRATEKCY